jgi:hypothetical protein
MATLFRRPLVLTPASPSKTAPDWVAITPGRSARCASDNVKNFWSPKSGSYPLIRGLDPALNASVRGEPFSAACLALFAIEENPTLTLGGSLPAILSAYPQPTSTARNLLYVDMPLPWQAALWRPHRSYDRHNGKVQGRFARVPSDGRRPCRCPRAERDRAGSRPVPRRAEKMDLARAVARRARSGTCRF